MDPLSGICHVGAGSLRHSLILHVTLGIFCLALVIAAAYVAVQKRLQEYRLKNSLTHEDTENPVENPLVNPTEKQGIKDGNETDKHESAASEHGLGDALFPDYWLGKRF